jgi:DNA invertase Pin-like site-specific DNA recombinase
MQVETGYSLDAQRAFITDDVHHKGWTLVEIFCDPGFSGTRSNRPALQALMSRAEHREFDGVVVHAVDRFYRDLGGLLAALHHLHQIHITFVSITENLDFTTPWGKLVLAVLGALAEIYIDKLRDETRKGKQARARKGLWNGSIPLGYCNGLCAACTDVNGKDYCPNSGQANRSRSGVLIAHPIESIAVGLTYKWYEMGNLSHRLIAEKLNAYELVLPHGTQRHFRTKRCNSQGGPQPITRSTVREILSRISYTGQVPYYGTNKQGIRLKRRNIAAIVSGQHPPLISQELFDRCQQLARGRLGKLSMAERISQSVPFVGEPVGAMV